FGTGFDPAGKDSDTVMVVSSNTRLLMLSQGVAATVSDEKEARVNRTQSMSGPLRPRPWSLRLLMHLIETQLFELVHRFFQVTHHRLCLASGRVPSRPPPTRTFL